MKPKQLVVLGDSGVYGWGDRDSGGWWERLNGTGCNGPQGRSIPSASAVMVERRPPAGMGSGIPRGTAASDAGRILLAVGLNDSAAGRADGRQQLSREALGFGMAQLLIEMGQHTQVLCRG